MALRKYGGLHAFVFVDHTTDPASTVLGNLFTLRTGSPRVHWAGSVVGDYQILAHVVHDDEADLAGLQDFIEGGLRDKGIRCQWGIELLTAGPNMPKIHTPEILALVGIKAEHGKAVGILEQLEEIDEAQGGGWLQGASLITGHLDVLVQLNATTFEEARERILDPALANIQGIAWTSTAVADGSRGPFGMS